MGSHKQLADVQTTLSFDSSTYLRFKKMPCFCQTNLQATFVLGIIGLVFGCLACAFQNYAGLIGIVASICFIVGAKSPNPSAILVGMIFACIECVGMIIYAIILIVGGGIFASSTADFRSYGLSGHQNQQLNAILDQHAANLETIQATGAALFIVGGVYTVGVVIFQIWTIIVANKARKEIDEGIRI